MYKEELRKFLKNIAIGGFIILISSFIFGLVMYNGHTPQTQFLAFIPWIIALVIIVRASINLFVYVLPEEKKQP